jgi:hypothetical protein
VALQTEGPTAELLVVEPPQELLQQQELRPLELMRLPGLELRQLQLVEFLPLVELRLRLRELELEPLGFEPALALGPPLLRQLLVELQKQLELQLVELLRKEQ